MSSDFREEDTETKLYPKSVGRYEIRRELGKGGFGRVYLAHDSQLARDVAIKVPHEKWRGTIQTEKYLEEARMVAKLDHPNIVPVYDVGASEDFDCFIVSKYIEGTNLHEVIRRGRIDPTAAVQLCAVIADALHHAHKRGLVHRDIKPGNILIDQENKPYLADFGLAVTDERRLREGGLAGTPAYMSPEQVRREGHRIDGRSDLFSLGAVLYELLAGRRAFKGSTRSELQEKVELYHPRPLRQYDESIPRELDRICQKAMAKRANERYWTAHDFAVDLRSYLEDSGSTQESMDQMESLVETSSRPVHDAPPSAETFGDSSREKSGLHLSSAGEPVLPKGLRSFDSHDADFFLSLLPGPRDRDGTPNSIRFWKNQFESTAREGAFSVGLLYGPSGCGKSSFMKAGLLPRLSDQILPLFIEATSHRTEDSILQTLRRQFPELDAQVSLQEAIERIRCGDVRTGGRKIVLILDQFERWLHAADETTARDLVKALRQCDGTRIASVLMVRSDFWMSIVRFLNELEVDLVQGQNFAAIDLFPPQHAERVLTLFGRAFGALPPTSALEKEQEKFIQEAIEGLQTDGKIICVRLALFAEMMKHKSWDVDTLRKLGGTAGVGVSYLNDSFGAQSNPKFRLHQQAAQRVLRSLLPAAGMEVNVNNKSYSDLKADSKYRDDSKFEELIQILDTELKLISPIDSSKQDASDSTHSTAQQDTKSREYQLSHDYLVGALRAWLTSQQRETRAGRAQLLLEERSSFWNNKQENRYLPSLLEHYQIRTLTNSREWTRPQKALMGQAAKAHGRWLLIGLAGILAVVLAGFGIRHKILANQEQIQSQQRLVQHEAEARRLVDGMVKADVNRVGDFLEDLEGYREWATPMMQEAFGQFPDESLEKINCSIALCQTAETGNEKASEYLWQMIPSVDANLLVPVFQALRSTTTTLPEDFPRRASDPLTRSRTRLRMAAAISQFEPNHDFWNNPAHVQFVARELTLLYPSELPPIRAALEPVSAKLLPVLEEIFLDKEEPSQQRIFATDTISTYLDKNRKELAELFFDSEQDQFELLFEKLQSNDELLAQSAREILADDSEGTPERSTEALAQRKANALVTLYRLNQFGEFDGVLSSKGDPDLESKIIHFFSSRKCEPTALLERLESGIDDSTMLFRLILAIGEYSKDSLSADFQKRAISAIRDIGETTQLVKIRAACQWSLGQLGAPDFFTGLAKQETLARKEEVLNWKTQKLRIENELVELRNRFRTKLDAWIDEMAKRELPDVREEYKIGNWKIDSTGKTIYYDSTRKAPANSLDICGDSIHFFGTSATVQELGNKLDVAGAFSFGCWLYSDVPAQYASAFSKIDEAGDYRGFDLWFEEGHVGVHFKHAWKDGGKDNDWLKIYAQTPFPYQQWHHVTVSYDGSRKASGVTIFMDGKPLKTEVVADSLTGTIVTPSPFVLGGRKSGFGFRGDLKEFFFTKQILTEQEVRLIHEESIIRAAQKISGTPFDSANSKFKEVLQREFWMVEGGEIAQKSRQLDAMEHQRVRKIREQTRDWFFAVNGQLMIRLTAGEFPMGEEQVADTEEHDQNRHTRKINRTFAIAHTEVTTQQWREFLKSDFAMESTRDKFAKNAIGEPDEPIGNISWIEAASYCNWLSEQAGIPKSQWCYEKIESINDRVAMRVKPGFLMLTGYRLPTESEWEYACRANTTTGRYFGDSLALVGKYIWYQGNTSKFQPVASKKPNGFGFFDMLGNAMEWCYDRHEPFQRFDGIVLDEPYVGTGVDNQPRALRGGAYYDIIRYLRSAHRYSYNPQSQLVSTGFRLARTLAPVDSEN